MSYRMSIVEADTKRIEDEGKSEDDTKSERSNDPMTVCAFCDNKGRIKINHASRIKQCERLFGVHVRRDRQIRMCTRCFKYLEIITKCWKKRDVMRTHFIENSRSKLNIAPEEADMESRMYSHLKTKAEVPANMMEIEEMDSSAKSCASALLDVLLGSNVPDNDKLKRKIVQGVEGTQRDAGTEFAAEKSGLSGVVERGNQVMDHISSKSGKDTVEHSNPGFGLVAQSVRPGKEYDVSFDILDTTVLESHQCPTCVNLFTQERKFSIHTQKVHDGYRCRRYICTFCPAGFNELTECEQHYLAHVEEWSTKAKDVDSALLGKECFGEKYNRICRYCRFTLPDINAKVAHEKRHTYKCGFCSSRHISLPTKQQHEKIAHPDELAEQQESARVAELSDVEASKAGNVKSLSRAIPSKAKSIVPTVSSTTQLAGKVASVKATAKDPSGKSSTSRNVAKKSTGGRVLPKVVVTEGAQSIAEPLPLEASGVRLKFSCLFCRHVFSNAIESAAHEAKHTEPCALCSAVLTSAKSLRRHTARMHGNKSRPPKPVQVEPPDAAAVAASVLSETAQVKPPLVEPAASDVPPEPTQVKPTSSAVLLEPAQAKPATAAAVKNSSKQPSKAAKNLPDAYANIPNLFQSDSTSEEESDNDNCGKSYEKHECDICAEVFSTARENQDHQLSHMDNRYYDLASSKELPMKEVQLVLHRVPFLSHVAHESTVAELSAPSTPVPEDTSNEPSVARQSEESPVSHTEDHDVLFESPRASNHTEDVDILEKPTGNSKEQTRGNDPDAHRSSEKHWVPPKSCAAPALTLTPDIFGKACEPAVGSSKHIPAVGKRLINAREERHVDHGKDVQEAMVEATASCISLLARDNSDGSKALHERKDTEHTCSNMSGINVLTIDRCQRGGKQSDSPVGVSTGHKAELSPGCNEAKCEGLDTNATDSLLSPSVPIISVGALESKMKDNSTAAACWMDSDSEAACRLSVSIPEDDRQNSGEEVSQPTHTSQRVRAKNVNRLKQFFVSRLKKQPEDRSGAVRPPLPTSATATTSSTLCAKEETNPGLPNLEPHCLPSAQNSNNASSSPTECMPNTTVTSKPQEDIQQVICVTFTGPNCNQNSSESANFGKVDQPTAVVETQAVAISAPQSSTEDVNGVAKIMASPTTRLAEEMNKEAAHEVGVSNLSSENSPENSPSMKQDVAVPNTTPINSDQSGRLNSVRYGSAATLLTSGNSSVKKKGERVGSDRIEHCETHSKGCVELKRTHSQASSRPSRDKKLCAADSSSPPKKRKATDNLTRRPSVSVVVPPTNVSRKSKTNHPGTNASVTSATIPRPRDVPQSALRMPKHSSMPKQSLPVTQFAAKPKAVMYVGKRPGSNSGTSQPVSIKRLPTVSNSKPQITSFEATPSEKGKPTMNTNSAQPSPKKVDTQAATSIGSGPSRTGVYVGNSIASSSKIHSPDSSSSSIPASATINLSVRETPGGSPPVTKKPTHSAAMIMKHKLLNRAKESATTPKPAVSLPGTSTYCIQSPSQRKQLAMKSPSSSSPMVSGLQSSDVPPVSPSINKSNKPKPPVSHSTEEPYPLSRGRPVQPEDLRKKLTQQRLQRMPVSPAYSKQGLLEHSPGTGAQNKIRVQEGRHNSIDGDPSQRNSRNDFLESGGHGNNFPEAPYRSFHDSQQRESLLMTGRYESTGKELSSSGCFRQGQADASAVDMHLEQACSYSENVLNALRETDKVPFELQVSKPAHHGEEHSFPREDDVDVRRSRAEELLDSPRSPSAIGDRNDRISPHYNNVQHGSLTDDADSPYRLSRVSRHGLQYTTDPQSGVHCQRNDELRDLENTQGDCHYGNHYDNKKSRTSNETSAPRSNPTSRNPSYESASRSSSFRSNSSRRAEFDNEHNRSLPDRYARDCSPAGVNNLQNFPNKSLDNPRRSQAERFPVNSRSTAGNRFAHRAADHHDERGHLDQKESQSSSLRRGQSSSALRRGQPSSTLRRGQSSTALRRGQSSSALRRGQSSSWVRIGAAEAGKRLSIEEGNNIGHPTRGQQIGRYQYDSRQKKGKGWGKPFRSATGLVRGGHASQMNRSYAGDATDTSWASNTHNSPTGLGSRTREEMGEPLSRSFREKILFLRAGMRELDTNKACYVCGIAFGPNGRSKLLLHLHLNPCGKRPFYCEDCEKPFKSLRDTILHHFNGCYTRLKQVPSFDELLKVYL